MLTKIEGLGSFGWGTLNIKESDTEEEKICKNKIREILSAFGGENGLNQIEETILNTGVSSEYVDIIIIHELEYLLAAFGINILEIIDYALPFPLVPFTMCPSSCFQKLQLTEKHNAE